MTSITFRDLASGFVRGDVGADALLVAARAERGELANGVLAAITRWENSQDSEDDLRTVVKGLLA